MKSHPESHFTAHTLTRSLTLWYTICMKKFNVNDVVLFDVIPGNPLYRGEGTILGVAFETIIILYIVLLHTPILGQRAMVIPESLMTPAIDRARVPFL